MACLLTQDPDERIDACTVAIENGGLTSALLSDAYSIRGLMHAQRGDFPEAKADLKRAGETDPTRQQEKTAAILAQIEDVEAAGDNLTGRVLLSACQGWRDPVRQSKACDKLVENMKATPADRAAALTLRGSVAVMAGRDAAGMRDLDEALRLSPTEPKVRIWRAKALWLIGRYAEAKQEMDRSIAGGQDRADWVKELAAYAYMQGDVSGAVGILESIPVADGRIERFYAAMLRAEMKKVDSPELFDIPVSPADGRFAAASIEYRRGHASEAQLLAAVDSLPAHSKVRASCQAHFSIGQRAAIEGRKAKAVDEFGRSASSCDRGVFEYSLANFWLKRLKA